MRARRVWAGVAAAGVTAGLGIVGAVPASAASAGCDFLNGASGSGEGQVAWQSLAFQAGERLTVTWSALSSPAPVVDLLVPGNVIVDTRVGAGSVTYLFATDTVADGNSLVVGGTGTWSISCGDPALTSEPASKAESGPTSSPAPIPAWVQAYGRADKDATCIDGWSPSWQKWSEPVTGGWVCTRSIPSLG